MIQIRGLKAAYRKIFMSVDENAESFEERLAEVVFLFCVFVCCFKEVRDVSGGS